VAVAALLAQGLISAAAIGTAEAWWWSKDTKKKHHDRYDKKHVKTPEPSALYAIGSALGLLGGAAWFVRRK
jgi:hypothetical protein